MNPKLLMSYVVAFVAALVTMYAAFEYIRIVPSAELAYAREGTTLSAGASFCVHASRYGLGYFLIALCTAVLVKEQMLSDWRRRMLISGAVLVFSVALVLFTEHVV